MEKRRIEHSAIGNLHSVYYVPDFLSSAEHHYLLHQVNNAPSSKWKVLKNRRLQSWGGVVHEKGLIPQLLPTWLKSITERISAETGFFPSPVNHVLVNEYHPGQGILVCTSFVGSALSGEVAFQRMPHQDGPLYYPVVAIVSLGSPAVLKFSPHPRTVTDKRKPHSSVQDVECKSDLQIIQDEADVDINSINEAGMKEEKIQCSQSLVLMPRSLLVFKDTAYTDYLHGIDECMEHILDEKVLNFDEHLKTHPLLSMCGGSGYDNANILKRTGIRISLTCRLVTSVQGKFLRIKSV